MSLLDLLENITLGDIEHTPEIIIETDKFEFYKLALKKIIGNQVFNWTINKTVDEIYALKWKMRTFNKLMFQNECLPSKRAFLKLQIADRIKRLRDYFFFLLDGKCFNNHLLQFLEISEKSFLLDMKMKEGYVYKYGSGRRTNQKRCFNFCNKIFGYRKMWLRVLPDGIECSETNETTEVLEVINFCKEFNVEYGWNDTEFICGVSLLTSQHKFLFLANSLLERDEFVEAIRNSFRNSDMNRESIRFNSSFLPRYMNGAKFYVDGCDYFADVYDSLSKARVAVCITDWWLSPQLYLKRPRKYFENTRLIDILGEIADRGVQVYVLLYKELTFTLTLNSLYSKKVLQSRSPNIKVIRHPTFSIRGGEFLWSHHAKIMCIDNTIAFVGGLDLCYGRWDTQSHELIDLDGETWPGIDYSNVRVADFINVDQFETDSISRENIPRMPWHDIAVSVTGVIVKDVWNHFIQLWNHVIKDITGSKSKNKVLDLVHTRMHQNPDDLQSGRFYEKYSDAENKTVEVIQNKELNHKNSEIDHKSIDINLKDSGLSASTNSKPDELNNIRKRYDKKKNTFCMKNYLEKIDDSQQSTEPNIRLKSMNIFKHLIEKNNLLAPYPNQRSIFKTNQQVINKEEDEETDIKETCQFYTRNPNDFSKLTDISSRSSASYINKSGNTNIECQIVRSAGPWSMGRHKTEESIHTAYQDLIMAAEKFIYIENQFFISNSAGDPVMNTIAEVIVNRIRKAIVCSEDFKVIVLIPLLPAFEGNVDDPTASVLRVQLHYEYKTICRGKRSILSQLREYTYYPEKYIKFYSLRTHALLNNQPVTEMIYIHSKLMIVDDTTVIVGSANINDRSLLGDRDAEICLVMTDKQKQFVRFGDREFECSKFAHEFRMNIFQEHSGCGEIGVLEDPFSEDFYLAWEKRASDNTRYFRKIFRCYPDDEISKLTDVKMYSEKAKLQKYGKYSKKIKGHLVEFPLNFLKDENLNITVKQKEYLLPDITFT